MLLFLVAVKQADQWAACAEPRAETPFGQELAFARGGMGLDGSGRWVSRAG